MSRETGAALLREARSRARLSQNDLARRADVAQSVISAYESGHRQPTLPTLERLIAATGNRVVIDLEPIVDHAVKGLPDSRLGRRLRQRRQAVIDAAMRRGASNVRVFGSAARGDDGDDSDIDLLVDLAPRVGLVGLAGLIRELTELLGVPVDVVPADSVKPRMRASIDRDAVAL